MGFIINSLSQCSYARAVSREVQCTGVNKGHGGRGVSWRVSSVKSDTVSVQAQWRDKTWGEYALRCVRSDTGVCVLQQQQQQLAVSRVQQLEWHGLVSRCVSGHFRVSSLLIVSCVSGGTQNKSVNLISLVRVSAGHRSSSSGSQWSYHGVRGRRQSV